MTTPPVTDQQPITAADPRVQQILAMIQAKAAQSPVAPAPSDPQPAQIAPIAAPQAPPAPNVALPNGPQLPNLPPMQGGQPQIAPPPAPDVTQAPSKPGPVKSFLQHLVSGLGTDIYAGSQGALQKLGLPTDYEKQQTAAKLAIAQQQANDTSQYRQALTDLTVGKGAQLDAYNQPYTFANDDSVTPSLRGKTFPTIVAQGFIKQGLANQGKTDVAGIAANAGSVTLTPQYAQRLGMPQLAGQTVGGKQLGSLNKMLQGTGANVIEGDIGNGHVGLIDKDTRQVLQDYGTSQKIIGANIGAANKTVQVVDPNDPNSTVQMTPQQANRIGAQGTQSVGYQANKAITKYFTSGDGAKNLNSFNTATDHLKQLGVVASALGNGDMQLFNKWGNAYAQQTGSTAPTNFNAVKTAVAGEIGKVFKGGNATDNEIAEMNSTINNAQSPQQLKGVIQTYTDLMNSKRNALQQQYVQGKQGQPNFPGTPPTSGGATRTYQGHTYSQGSDGQWHLQ